MGELNILIPMAGNGSRFINEGYDTPKPLIDVLGKPMVEWVLDDFKNIENKKFIFICRKEHQDRHSIKDVLESLAPGCEIVFVDHLTQGAACTTLLASESINNNKALIIVNADQYVEWDECEFMRFASDDLDAAILTFESESAKYSYVRLSEQGFVTEVAEKKVISNEATGGVYFWKHGADYVRYANEMIKKEIRVNNEFYVCPVFNEAILGQKKIKTFKIGRNKMWDLGTPDDLRIFVEAYGPKSST